MKRAERPTCDNCDEPALELVYMDGVAIVDAPTSAPAAAAPALCALRDLETRSAPRRPARWCLKCVRKHEQWQASQRRRPRPSRAPHGGASCR